MYCYHCMTKLKDDVRFCHHCGASVVPEDIPHHLLPGTVLEDKYLVGNSLGEGGFGITYIGLDMSLDPPVRVAVKEFYPNGYANRNNRVTNKVTLNYQNDGEYFRNGKLQFLNEAQNLFSFRGEPGIVNVRDFFTANDTAYIIMEYVDGETLTQHIKTHGLFAPEEIFRLMLPMMGSLHKMHSKSIIHRDISPDNIKVTSNGTLMLLDFGAARYFSGAQKKTMSVMYKPGYAPYEQYGTDSPQGAYTDVYGLCATIYKCITDIRPVDSVKRVGGDTLQSPSALGVPISKSLETVLHYGMAVRPEERCPDMNTLASLTESALRGEDIPTHRGRDDDNRTIVAVDRDDGTDDGWDYIPPQTEEPPVADSGDGNMKKILILMFVLILLAIGTVALLGFLVLQSEKTGAAVSRAAAPPAVTRAATPDG